MRATAFGGIGKAGVRRFHMVPAQLGIDATAGCR